MTAFNSEEQESFGRWKYAEHSVSPDGRSISETYHSKQRYEVPQGKSRLEEVGPEVRVTPEEFCLHLRLSEHPFLTRWADLIRDGIPTTCANLHAS